MTLGYHPLVKRLLDGELSRERRRCAWSARWIAPRSSSRRRSTTA